MPDQDAALRQRYAEAIHNAHTEKLEGFQTFATSMDMALFEADAILAVRDEEIAALRARIAELEAALADADQEHLRLARSVTDLAALDEPEAHHD